MAAKGTTNLAHTGFLLQLVHEVKAPVGLLMVSMVKVGRLGKNPPNNRHSEEYSQKVGKQKEKEKRSYSKSRVSGHNRGGGDVIRIESL